MTNMRQLPDAPRPRSPWPALAVLAIVLGSAGLLGYAPHPAEAVAAIRSLLADPVILAIIGTILGGPLLVSQKTRAFAGSIVGAVQGLLDSGSPKEPGAVDDQSDDGQRPAA